MFSEKEFSWKEVSVLILIAYVFSFTIRMIWVLQFQDNPNFIWNNQLMINTNDGYFFASAVEYLLKGLHVDNPRVQIAIDSYPGMIYVTYFLTKYTPFSLETVTLYLPPVISSLVVIPLILTGKLIKLPWIGFLAALLGSIVVSYYNRTMAGYYDSDMFSVFLQFVVLYFFLFTLYVKEDKNVLWLAFSLLIYPFFYPQGLSLIYAIFILWAGYQLVFQRKEQNSYLFIIVASVALWAVPISVKVVLIIFIFLFLEQIKSKIDNQKFLYLTLFAILVFFFFGNVFSLILEKIGSYLNRGVEDSGLHFYQVIQTVREAGAISLSTVAERISGSSIGLLVSLLGYLFLVVRHKVFIIALPLIGVGVFSHWAGLRFTVYAVPIASLSAIYFFHVITTKISNKKSIYIVAMTLMTVSMIYPNIRHIIDYKVPTVLNNTEVDDLVKLDAMASPKDYTLAWWDYGYPVWYYSDTATLIDGSKHHNDNFIISKIMQTSSPDLAANLSRLAVETYVDSNYSEVADTLFKNKQKDQLDPNVFLSELDDAAYPLPEKTRDIYLYLPYRMMSIFPTVAVFGNLDLTTGKEERGFVFYPTQAISQNQGVLSFSNGIVFDANKGEIALGQQTKPVKQFIITQSTTEGKVQVQSQTYHADGEYVVMFLKSYGQFVVMDTQTFESMYVQMFMLGKYDERLFELVVSSPYSKIYKLKK
jgi:dolichyl-diphosphooligosaccharide--protein glycosyltransferase/undecaprenyl-diphosphooligosaccharide--protein glycosyltransferase